MAFSETENKILKQVLKHALNYGVPVGDKNLGGLVHSAVYTVYTAYSIYIACTKKVKTKFAINEGFL